MKSGRKKRVAVRGKRIETLIRKIYNVQASDAQSQEAGARVPRQVPGYAYYIATLAKNR